MRFAAGGKAPRRRARGGIWLTTVVLALAGLGSAPSRAEQVPPACAAFLGDWSGTWSQGFYGTQRIQVTQVSPQCVATLAYSPTPEASKVAHQLPIRDGVIAFTCNVPGSQCRMEVLEGVLRFTYQDPSGFVNHGAFRRD